MIKVIKEGKIENYKFKKTCSVCGCEFEYELRDLHKDYDYSMCLTTFPSQYRYSRYVNCPCCGERVFHDSGCDYGDNLQYPNAILTTNDSIEDAIKKQKEASDRMFLVDLKHPNVVWNNNYNCETCPNKPNFKDGKPIFGDTPCTFCKKKTPSCK